MKKNNSQIIWYLVTIYIFTFGLGILELIFQTGIFYQILQKGFTAVPVVTALLICKMTGEKQGIKLSLKVWKNWRMWLFSAFVPGILIALGSVLYFLIFSDEYSGVFELGQIIGSKMRIEITSPIVFAIVCVMISALCIPLHLLELGEEVGWRGWLLWYQVEKHGARKAVLINGLEWGLAHMPLIYLGFNYSMENPGAPWSNMAVMMVLCIVTGIIFSYVTDRRNSCILLRVVKKWITWPKSDRGVVDGIFDCVGSWFVCWIGKER